MSYNRTLDLLAMSLASTQAGMPVKAANYMHAAATDVSASAAVDAIFAANKKKKPAKKKAKAGMSVFAELGLDEDEHEDDTVASLRAALEDGEDEGEEETSNADEMGPEDEFSIKSFTSSSARVRAARRALAEAEAEADEEGEKEEADATPEDVFTMKSSASARVRAARRALAEATEDDDIQVGEELREEVPATRSKASFARALRNIAARQR